MCASVSSCHDMPRKRLGSGEAWKQVPFANASDWSVELTQTTLNSVFRVLEVLEFTNHGLIVSDVSDAFSMF